MISVPLGMGISLISVPSRPRMGDESGRMTSLIGLWVRKCGRQSRWMGSVVCEERSGRTAV